MSKLKKQIILSAALATLSSPVVAQDNDWNYRAFVYLWAPELGATTTTGQDTSVSFSTLLDNLDFGLMGALEANRGPWSLLGDFQYLDLGADANAPVGPGIPVQADADITGFVFTGSVGYDLRHTQTGQMVAFGGLRYLDMDATVNLAVGPGSQRVSGSISNWDGIVGLRGSHPLADRWNISYYADVGAGDSDLTWQAGLTFDYQINNWYLSFGYRHLEWDIDNSNVLTNMSFSGPIFGARIPF